MRLALDHQTAIYRLSAGTALFDTGLRPDCQRDPAARVGRRVAGPFTFDYHPGEEIAARLAAFGRDPGRIDLIINFCRTLRERRLPRFAHDRDGVLAALDRLAALEAGGARIFFGHEPEFWAAVPQAPIALA